jgi:hypothetical protein
VFTKSRTNGALYWKESYDARTIQVPNGNGGKRTVPIGGFGDAVQLADWVVFMLSDSADFLCGSVVFVDGGSDAYFRPDDWPRAVPARRLLSYLRRTRQYSQRSRP